MTQENKDILLKDLCARLPYGVKLKKLTKVDSDIADIGATVKLYSINLESYCDIRFYTYEGKALTVCEEGRLFRPGYFLRYKPYLFPMSSMTEEQMNASPVSLSILELLKENSSFDIIEYSKLNLSFSELVILIDWFNKNHFDYRGLLEKGLAIDATGKNIY